MANSTRSKAEIRLAAVRTTEKPVPNDGDEQRRQRAEKTAKLKALRLEKEAAAQKEETGSKKPLRLPQAHRPQY